jgi:hypothetical protein
VRSRIVYLNSNDPNPSSPGSSHPQTSASVVEPPQNPAWIYLSGLQTRSRTYMFFTSSLITSSSLQAPLSRHEHQPSSTLPNIAGLQTYFTHPTAQGNLFGERVTTHPAPYPIQALPSSHVGPLPLSGSNFSSILTSHVTNSYAPTSVTPGNPAVQTHFIDSIAQGNLLGEHVAAQYATVSFDSSISRVRPPPPGSSDTTSIFAFPNVDPYNTSMPSLTVSSPSGATSSCPPLCSSIAMYNSSNDHPWLRKRDPHLSDLECEPKRKRAKQNPTEERSTDRQNEFITAIPSATGGVMPSVPTPTSTSEDGDVTSEQESEEEWSIQYNNEVDRAFNVDLIHSLPEV